MPRFRHWVHALDKRIIPLIGRLPKWWRPVMEFCSNYGHPAVMVGLTLIVLGGATQYGERSLVMAAALTLVFLPISFLAKRLWRRVRPETALALGLHTYSFPSGHSYVSFLVLGLLCFITLSVVMGPWNWLVAGGLILLTAGIGISRVYLGAHFPTDVIGGWALAAAMLFIVMRVGGL